ncbi:MAG: hypothetical protein EXR81_00520 [Gammaproteobacteria bacterium]|nr:hypothetical protein [Gammaproteobacteria bacterium]
MLTKSIKAESLSFLDLLVRMTTWIAREYPNGTAVTSVIATSTIQARGLTTLIANVNSDIHDSTPKQLTLTFSLLAFFMVANLKQGDKLATYAAALRAQILGVPPPSPRAHLLCIQNPRMIKFFKGLNFAANFTANSFSAANAAQSIFASHSSSKLPTEIAAPLAAACQVLALIEFYELYNLPEPWPRIAATLFAIPDAILYGNAILSFGTNNFLIALFVMLTLIAIMGIYRQYLGGIRFDRALQRDPSQLFIKPSESQALLASQQDIETLAIVKQLTFLEQLGLDNQQGFVLLQLLTVALKTFGMVIAMKSTGELVLKGMQGDIENTWDIILIIVMSLFCVFGYFSNAIARNLMAECGLNSMDQARIHIQK